MDSRHGLRGQWGFRRHDSTVDELVIEVGRATGRFSSQLACGLLELLTHILNMMSCRAVSILTARSRCVLPLFEIIEAALLTARSSTSKEIQGLLSRLATSFDMEISEPTEYTYNADLLDTKFNRVIYQAPKSITTCLKNYRNYLRPSPPNALSSSSPLFAASCI